VKVVVTGANGMLGKDLQRVFAGNELVALKRDDLDITSLNDSLGIMKRLPYTDVDGSELDPEKAYAVNGLGTRNIAMSCEEVKCPIMYISSDYVFDGARSEPYNEWDATNPVNKYGLSKLMGENFVSTMTNRFYIVRTSWLYGSNGNNFVDTMKKLFTERDEIDVVDDQRGCPTFTYDLALALKELAGRGYGTYHITNSSVCSWHEFAVEIASLSGSRTRIRTTTSDQFNRPAKRPAFSVLGNTMLKLEGISELRHWKDALKEYMKG
jgi:dTDP-4-dehydrorhamnose reductase